MLIRSQDKKCLIEMNKIIIQASGTEAICYDTSCIADEGYVCLGKYEPEAKAMKVLDMIQEAYADEKLVDYTTCLQRKEIEKMDDSTILALRNELMKKAVFQMPEDSEVEP
nr:MAG TPA: hypothetical protein [Caudoviricetes sp.]